MIQTEKHITSGTQIFSDGDLLKVSEENKETSRAGKQGRRWVEEEVSRLTDSLGLVTFACLRRMAEGKAEG